MTNDETARFAIEHSSWMEPQLLRPGIQDRTRWWSREDVLLILLLGAILFLPGLADVPLIDRDEPRFASAGRAMVQSGDYIVPRFNEDIRPDKPPLIYWLQAGVFQIGRFFNGELPFNETVARLPSAICSMLTLLTVYFAAGRRFGRVTGLLAAMMTGSAAVFLVQSRMSTADGSMVLFATMAMTCAWRAFEAGEDQDGMEYRRALPKADSLDPAEAHAALDFGALKPARDAGRMPLWVAILFWIALGLGTLAKGMPLIFVLLSLVTVSIATGRLGSEVRRHATDFFRRRNVLLALCLAPAVVLIYAVPQLRDQRGWLSALWVILCIGIAMPHLPVYIFRYGGRLGNWRWWKQLRPLIGVPILLAVVLPWFVSAWMKTNGELIQVMLGRHVVDRAIQGMEGHLAPPGFYLATIWGGFWPWSILLLPAGFHVVRRLLGKTAVVIDPRPYQFLVCWIVPVWLLLELAKTKLIHYPMPLYPALAILCADMLVQSWLRLTDVLAAPWVKSARWFVSGIWIVLALAAAGAVKVYLPALFPLALFFAGVLTVAAVGSAATWGKPSWPFVVTLAWAGAMFTAEVFILPNVSEMRVSQTIGRAVAAMRKIDPSYRVAAYGYVEDTLVFYCETPVLRPGKKERPADFPTGLDDKQPLRRTQIEQAVPKLMSVLEFQKKDSELQSALKPATIPAPVMPRQKWLLVVDQDVLDAFDRQGVKYYAHDVYGEIPASAAGMNMAKWTPVKVRVIANYPPPGWEERPPGEILPPPLTSRPRGSNAQPTQPASTASAAAATNPS